MLLGGGNSISATLRRCAYDLRDGGVEEPVAKKSPEDGSVKKVDGE